MSAETLFTICGRVAMVGWIVLIVAPRWRWSAPIIGKFVIPLLLAMVYVGVLATHAAGSRGGFSSLAAVGELFADPWILLSGWVHYLAFDLFVGAWEVRDAARSGVPHWLVVPCLLLTFLVGPTGLLAYCTCRAVVGAILRRAERKPTGGMSADL